MPREIRLLKNIKTPVRRGFYWRMELFNQLTAKETELLGATLEECGEVVQECGKILRHGFESYKPTDPEQITNREKIISELADVVAMVELLEEHGILDLWNFEELKIKKKNRFYQYAHHINDLR
jgi:NTP pyrophosphatase (non-canonical NTP hydrolase)